MSVLRKPGWIATTVMPASRRCTDCRTLIMLSAAFDAV